MTHLVAPRRDETALNGKSLSLRHQVYLESLADELNSINTIVESESTENFDANIIAVQLQAQLQKHNKDIEGLEGLIADLAVKNNSLLAQLEAAKHRILDLENLTAETFNYG